ncbi:hypothetical protein GIB67_008923, partial [Kingdonia uniflora]
MVNSYEIDDALFFKGLKLLGGKDEHNYRVIFLGIEPEHRLGKLQTNVNLYLILRIFVFVFVIYTGSFLCICVCYIYMFFSMYLCLLYKLVFFYVFVFAIYTVLSNVFVFA